MSVCDAKCQAKALFALLTGIQSCKDEFGKVVVP